MSCHSRGARADGNLFSPSDMTPWIVANTSRKEASEPTGSVILPPIFWWGQKQARIAITGQIPVPADLSVSVQ